MRVIPALCTALILSIFPLTAQDAPALPGEVIRTLAAKCEASKAYAFDGQLMLYAQSGTDPARLVSNAKVKFAAAPGGKFLLRLEAEGKDGYSLQCDGQKSWAYVPGLKRYTEQESAPLEAGDDKEEAAGDTERDPAEVFTRTVMPLLAEMYKKAAGCDTSGLAEVRYEKKKQKWPVYRTMFKPDEQEGKTLLELTLDPPTGRIGTMIWSNLTVRNGRPMKIRLEMHFDHFQPGEAVDESIFTFDPPKNVKLAETLPIPGQTGSALLNQAAPSFELKTLDGEKIELAGLRGRPVLLDFWATWCGPCRRELPSIAKLHQEYRDKGLLVFGINDEGKGTARKYLEKAGLELPTLDDSGLKAHRLFRVRSIPAVFLIDRDGKVIRFFSGAKDEATLRAALKLVGLD